MYKLPTLALFLLGTVLCPINFFFYSIFFAFNINHNFFHYLIKMFRSSVLLTAAALSAGITKFTAMNEGALNPKEFQPYKVKDIKRISPNTNILEVELPDNQNMVRIKKPIKIINFLFLLHLFYLLYF